jgi:hypothetical protein
MHHAIFWVQEPRESRLLLLVIISVLGLLDNSTSCFLTSRGPLSLCRQQHNGIRTDKQPVCMNTSRDVTKIVWSADITTNPKYTCSKHDHDRLRDFNLQLR